MAHENIFEIIVNLEEKTIAEQTVTFDQIVQLAFPDKAADPNVTFKVTYRKAESQPHGGSIVEGDKVEVKKNGKTSFTVVHATKS
jgi:hypothetical protein